MFGWLGIRSNTDATAEERKIAWKGARKDFKKIGMKALKKLEKTGFEATEKEVKMSA
ncbi:hypothetical protein N9573_02360 [Octadecabacter sp.]|nr:hypothetical protein [Octadecabacter sp.]